ncbi:MAG: cell division protein FtsQ [Porticoccaceae bacterium]|jgi:cell division protein FtsQ|tara:strand:+ start:276 stop:1079 length:804 start_codon:yes stop_codon:yes gene_type:complete
MTRKARRGANFNEQQPRLSDGIAEKFLRLLMVTVFVAAIFGADFIYKQIDTPLSKIMVGGNFNHLEEQELAELVNIEIDGGFLSMNLNQLRQELQSHPWIHQVSVRREWPSTLKVEVIEEVPIARWGKKGFLNRLGDQLSLPENSNLKSLPVLEADFGSSQDMIAQYLLLAELLAPTDLRLTELQRDAVGAWQIETASGVRIVLGRDQIIEKIRRLIVVWGSGLDVQLNNIATIDLRYPNGLAVSWRDQDITISGFGHEPTTDSSAA